MPRNRHHGEHYLIPIRPSRRPANPVFAVPLMAGRLVAAGLLLATVLSQTRAAPSADEPLTQAAASAETGPMPHEVGPGPEAGPDRP